jgi:hypothetical protein
LARAVREALRPDGRFVIVNWHQCDREETTVLGEPRGPRTELRLSPKQTVEAVQTSSLVLARIVELARCSIDRRPENDFAQRHGFFYRKRGVGG